MRKIILLEFISLDGVMQAPGGQQEDTSGGFAFGGWTVPYADDFGNKIMGEQMKGSFELLLGRKTYDIFAAYWPQHDAIWPEANATKKYVVSKSLTNPTWQNTVVISDNVVDELKKLKAEDGPNMYVYGSGNLAQTLLENGLVDELWLKTYPVTLGSGKKLFAEGTIPAAFKLTDCKVSPKGVIFANYERAGEVTTGMFE
jgi:dihydrofolate reductase